MQPARWLIWLAPAPRALLSSPGSHHIQRTLRLWRKQIQIMSCISLTIRAGMKCKPGCCLRSRLPACALSLLHACNILTRECSNVRMPVCPVILRMLPQVYHHTLHHQRGHNHAMSMQTLHLSVFHMGMLSTMNATSSHAATQH